MRKLGRLGRHILPHKRNGQQPPRQRHKPVRLLRIGSRNRLGRQQPVLDPVDLGQDMRHKRVQPLVRKVQQPDLRVGHVRPHRLCRFLRTLCTVQHVVVHQRPRHALGHLLVGQVHQHPLRQQRLDRLVIVGTVKQDQVRRPLQRLQIRPCLQHTINLLQNRQRKRRVLRVDRHGPRRHRVQQVPRD